MSDGAPTSHRRITRTDFRPCSSCRTRSQAPLCPYTRGAIANRVEGTLVLLRYPLGGNRPSQTARLALSPPLHGAGENVRTIRVVFHRWLHPARERGIKASHLSYADRTNIQDQGTVKVLGSFRLLAGRRHLHRHYNFAESLAETAAE